MLASSASFVAAAAIIRSDSKHNGSSNRRLFISSVFFCFVNDLRLPPSGDAEIDTQRRNDKNDAHKAAGISPYSFQEQLTRRR